MSATSPLDGGKKRDDVSRMFSGVAARYDLLNSIISFGLHHAWRRLAVRVSGAGHGSRVLDLCCGTGDFVIEFSSATGGTGFVCGLDYCEEMLLAGRNKIERRAPGAGIVRADATEIPFPDNCFDAISTGFGIRNIERPEKCLSEMMRVLKPGGRVVILEGGWPANPVVAAGFSIFAKWGIPVLGTLISGNYNAYRYLPESMKAFPAREKFIDMMGNEGFQSSSWISLGLGAVYIYTGQKAGISR